VFGTCEAVHNARDAEEVSDGNLDGTDEVCGCVGDYVGDGIGDSIGMALVTDLRVDRSAAWKVNDDGLIETHTGSMFNGIVSSKVT
jgi:hypothetical protein